jgi:hypothetical protein
VAANADLAKEVAQIRALVERDGGATVSKEQLLIICPDDLTVQEQFMCIASIAQREGWSFAFRSDGTVRFGTYAKP